MISLRPIEVFLSLFGHALFLFVCPFAFKTKISRRRSVISSSLNSLRQISLYEHGRDYYSSLYRVRNKKRNSKSVRNIFATFENLPISRRWKTSKAECFGPDWSAHFRTSATPLRWRWNCSYHIRDLVITIVRTRNSLRLRCLRRC